MWRNAHLRRLSIRTALLFGFGDSLSERVRENFQLVAEGRSSKEVAELLSISPATVETHRAHILQKLQLHNTVEVVRYATRRGIIQ